MPIGDPHLINVQSGRLQDAADVLRTLVNQAEQIMMAAQTKTRAPYWTGAAKPQFEAVVSTWLSNFQELSTSLSSGQGLTQASAVNWPFTDGKVASYW
ncbi:MAG: WXG100 family type VII secretion target [Mycobacteriales bacterium]|jgi:uncharacterized protein YukE